jgi:hypothetical protein
MRQFGVKVVGFLSELPIWIFYLVVYLCLRAQTMCIILEDCQGVRYSPLFYAVHNELAGCGHENNVKHAFSTYPLLM